FGPKKLPELGRAVGHTLKEFKNATRGLTKDDDEEEQKEQPKKPELTAASQTASAAPSLQKEDVDREKLEKEIRERLERERLEAEIREKIEKERLLTKEEQTKA
ncbi:MAG: twin-arginine translocase TatA/TatE family subunit, partial [Clostridia bacterium]